MIDRALTIAALALATASLLAMGCAEQGDLAAETPSEELESAEYVFVDHGQPQLDQSSESRFADACAEDCVSGWALSYAECMGTSRLIDSMEGAALDCRANAHQAVQSCLAASCAPTATVNAPSCAAACSQEAQLATESCLSTYGTYRTCETESTDVFQTCWQSDCLGDAFAGGLASEPIAGESAAQDVPEQEAAGDETLGCNAMCEELDLKAYLGCVANPESDIDACRDHTGDVLSECLALHCPHDE